MESKFVWKAKTVFQNAAAKAERVLTEIKADLVAELSSHSQGEHRGQLPWIGKTEQDKELEEEWRKRILEISKNPEFLFSHEDGKVDVDMQSAMAVLEWDENLKELRFQYVPKVMKEKEFWKRYFAAVKHVKRDVLASDLHPIEAALTSSGSTVETRASEAESPKKDPIEEEAYKKAMTVISIPPSMVIRRLASAIEAGRSFETMSDLAVSGVTEKDASQGSEWSTIVSGLKKLSIRAQSRSAETCHSLLCSLFDTDVQYEVNVNVENNKTRLSEELHGAPPQSFIAHLAEVIAGLKSEQKMAIFWLEIVKECRRRWANGEAIPRMPVDSNPDLNYCLLLQQIQVINCCIGRRKRRLAALESLDDQQLVDDSDCDLSFRQARLKDGQLVARICVDCRAENLNLKMLETGEPIYSPITQEGPVLTEDSIKENEELVMRTGSFGAGCSQLFSDMQAFKAANPGCILEDFVRWYSPLDWREDSSGAHKGSEPSLRGSLSTRMRSEGNLWQELWFSARPIPAVSQAPLFDEELAGESTLETLENIAPADFFEQLFITALCAGFAIAEAGSSTNKETFQKCLKECTDYILSTCHRHMDAATLEHLCEVYELMENAMHAPPEEQCDKQFDAKIFPEGKEKTESSSVSNQLADLKKFLQRKQGVEDSQGRDGPVSSVVKFFEGKTSLFDRKSKQQQSSAIEDNKLCSTECGDWTLV